MDRELIELRERVAALERALATMSSEQARHARGRRLPRVVGRLVAVVVTAAAVAGPVSLSLRAAGPTSVTAPFSVVNAAGRTLLQVSETEAGGQIQLFNSAVKSVAEIKVSKDGCCGRVDLYDMVKGSLQSKAVLGVDNNDSGVLRLSGSGGGFLQALDVGVGVQNTDGKVVAQLVADPDTDDGFVLVRNPSAESEARLSFRDGGGILQFSKKETPKATIGVSQDNIGMLRLAGAAGGRALLARGDGKLLATNTTGVEVMALGADNNDQGYVVAKDQGGNVAASVSAGGDGTGMVQVFRSKELSVVMGTKDGNKGDVCANGPKASACISVLAAKTFTQW
jgi:hypothetical protein